MRELPNTTGFDGYGETSWEAGDSSKASSGKVSRQDLISKANTVSLIRIFKYYNLRINEFQKSVTCPFKSHQGGRERTPSFSYYPHTNSFHCYGCKIGHEYAHGCEFVAAMDGISREKAALKILELFRDDVDENEVFDTPNFSEQLEIMLEFSNAVRDFRQSYLDEKSVKYIEGMCLVYDDLNLRSKPLNNEALRRIVEHFKLKISSYKP
jgi:DNA primase